MSIAEASRQLGVSVRQVQRLTSSGVLTHIGTVGRTKLIDAASVQRVKMRGISPGRPWSMNTIAASIDLLAGGEGTRQSSVERKRLHGRLGGMSAEDLVRATCSRAEVRRYRASASFLDHVRNVVALTGVAATDKDPALAKEFGLSRSAQISVDGYVDKRTADRLIRTCHLIEDAEGNVTLRVTETEILKRINTVIVALDLAESLDPRARVAGLAFLRQRLATMK
jgi:excisionase family DNA binding protein